MLALAPVNYTQAKMPYGTNYGVLLPACDGDVSTLQGARFFENAKYPTITTPTAVDNFAKVQWYVQGTNHNFFNTVWTQDDASTTHRPGLLAPAAGHHGAPDARRPAARRRRADELVLPPLRRQGDGIRPDHDRRGDAARVRRAAHERQGPRAGGQDLLRRARRAALRRAAPEPIPDPQPDPATGATPTPADATLTTTTASGGPISTSGLTSFFVCNPNDLAWRQGPTYPTAYPLCPEGATNRSKGNQFTVAWDAPGGYLRAFLGRAGAPVDVSKYGVLDLRAALNRADPRNPAGDGYTPNLVTQNFDVTLIDATGKRVSTRAANWSTALQPSIGNQFRHIVLNGIRIPLSAFAGIDLKQVTAVEFGFGSPALGSIQLADVMFQETAPASPGPERRRRRTSCRCRTARRRCSRARSSTRRTVPAPVVKTTLAAPLVTCVDTLKPTTKVALAKFSGSKLVVSGTAADTGCGAGIQNTLVEISKAAGKRKARFVNARGLLSKPLGLEGGVAIRAKGTTAWSVSVSKRKLPRGTYKVRVSTFDKAGNLTKAPVITLKVK